MSDSMMASYKWLLGLAIIAALSISHATAKEFKCYPQSDKLPDYVSPTHYELFINPNITTMTYDGLVDIMVKIADEPQNHEARERRSAGLRKIKDMLLCRHGGEECIEHEQTDSRSSNFIVLHVDSSIEIHRVEYSMLNNPAKIKNKDFPIQRICRDKERQILALEFFRDLPPGSEGKLQIKFRGEIRQDMRGIYRSFHQDDPSKAVVVSQFQGSDIRYAIPSFDEPRFKATVSLVIAMDPTKAAVAATEIASVDSKDIEDYNHKKARKWVVKFEKTPRMHLNLFAFAVGDIIYKKSKSRKSDVKVYVFAIKGYEHGYNFALETASRAIKWMEQYTGHKYPLAKFDLLAIPDHNKGNTENFGLATVRDVLIQMDEETREDAKITAAVNIVHVVAHQWFANLVTMSEWSDVWVTEGIAAHLAYEMVRDLFPEFPLDPLVRIGLLSTHIQMEATGKHRPLSPEKVLTSSQVDEIYDNFEFTKGSAILATLKNYLGSDGLRLGLKSLIENYSYRVATAKDFTRTLEEATGITIGKKLDSWLKLSGYPLLNVDKASDNSVVLFQEPNNESTTAMDRSEPRNFENLWWIPIQIRFSNSKGQSEVITVIIEPTNDETIVQAPDWFSFTNKDSYVNLNPSADLSTYYRVRYSSDVLGTILNAIHEDGLAPGNKVNLLDDSFYNTLNKLVSLEDNKKLVASLEKERDGAVLIALLIATGAVDKSDPNAAFPSGSSPFVSLFKEFGFGEIKNEPMIDQRARQTIYKRLIDIGDQQVIEAALEFYEKSNRNVPIFLRVPVYTAIVKSGNQEQISSLVSKLECRSYDEQLRIARALALGGEKQMNQLIEWMSKSQFKPDVAVEIVDSAKTAGLDLTKLDQDNNKLVEGWRNAPKPAIPTAN